MIAAGILTFVVIARNRSSDGQTGGTSLPVYDHGDWKDQKFLEDFTLTERSGELFHSQEMRGKVWVVSFFFSSCPYSCKTQNEKVKSLVSELGSDNVTFVSITCDPETDTPVVLRKYAYDFGAHPEHWLFLTGDYLHIRRIGAEIFQVPVVKEFHSESLLVVASGINCAACIAGRRMRASTSCEPK